MTRAEKKGGRGASRAGYGREADTGLVGRSLAVRQPVCSQK